MELQAKYSTPAILRASRDMRETNNTPPKPSTQATHTAVHYDTLVESANVTKRTIMADHFPGMKEEGSSQPGTSTITKKIMVPVLPRNFAVECKRRRDSLDFTSSIINVRADPNEIACRDFLSSCTRKSDH
jgi:hypothetical protein